MQVLDRIKEFLGFAPGEDDPDYAEETEEEVETPPTRRQTAQIIPISPLTRRSGPLRVVVVEPRDFEEVQTIVDQMKQGKPVILNLHGLDPALAQKILNFLNGAIYALNGETQRISEVIFFFAPVGVDVTVMGRGVTGTTISGGSVDLPPDVLTKLIGQGGTDALQQQATGRKPLSIYPPPRYGR